MHVYDGCRNVWYFLCWNVFCWVMVVMHKCVVGSGNWKCLTLLRMLVRNNEFIFFVQHGGWVVRGLLIFGIAPMRVSVHRAAEVATAVLRYAGVAIFYYPPPPYQIGVGTYGVRWGRERNLFTQNVIQDNSFWCSSCLDSRLSFLVVFYRVGLWWVIYTPFMWLRFRPTVLGRVWHFLYYCINVIRGAPYHNFLSPNVLEFLEQFLSCLVLFWNLKCRDLVLASSKSGWLET